MHKCQPINYGDTILIFSNTKSIGNTVAYERNTSIKPGSSAGFAPRGTEPFLNSPGRLLRLAAGGGNFPR
jgi:hypothetical protein